MRYSLALLIMVGIDLLSILFAMAGMIALGWGLWQLGLGFLWCALISMAIITGLWAIAEKVIDYRRSSRRLARGLVGVPEYLPASDNSNPQRPTDTELRRAAFWTAMGLSTVLFVLIFTTGVYLGGALMGAGAVGIGLLVFGWLFLQGGFGILLETFEQRLLEDSELRRDGPREKT